MDSDAGVADGLRFSDDVTPSVISRIIEQVVSCYCWTICLGIRD